MAYHNNPRIVTDGLVLCLDASHKNSYPGSGTTWYDLSGNNLNASFQGSPTYSDGKIIFNGTTDYLQISDNDALDGTTEKTICIWLNLAAYTSPGSIFCKRSDTSINDYFIFLYTGNTIWWDQGTGTRVNTGYLPPLNTWLNLCFVKNASARTLYVNGSSYNSYSAGTATATVSSLLIGRNTTAANYYINGTLGPVYIYNKSLTTSEVLQNYNATKGRYGL